MGSRWPDSGAARGDDYDRRWVAMQQRGENPHGEADFVAALAPASVLDAGCGTGRVAIELGRRGIDVAGVDLDEVMLATARRKAPELHWVVGDLVGVQLGRRFDAVVLAGNVMLFVSPGTERAVVANVASHLEEGGHLVAGFQLGGERLGIEAYDGYAIEAGLESVARYATWAGDPWTARCGYAVSLHRRPAA